MNSKTIKVLSMMLILLLTVNPLAYAFESSNPFDKNYPVRSERVSRNGVMMSRPNPFDEEISRVLNTNQIRTLEQYSRWVAGNIRYRKDGDSDTWTQPEITLEKKSGDCEDYAVFNMEVLGRLGFEVKFIGLFNEGRAHAICVVKQNGYYHWFNNGELHRTTARSIEDLAKEICDNYAYTQVSEYNNGADIWQVIYEEDQV